MWPLIGTMVALGISANEPTALLVVLVVLRSGRDRGAAFVTGWLVALAVVTIGAGFAIRLGLGPRRNGPRRITLIVELIVGIGLVMFAIWYWWRGRHGAHSTEEPHILRRLTSIGRVPAFVTGVITATYPPALVAGTTLFRSDASDIARIIALGTFLGIGTIMVATPVVGMYAAPNWTTHHMDRVYGWTLRHRRILLTTILGAVGVFVAVRAGMHLDEYH
jgi:hypothetical protein